MSDLKFLKIYIKDHDVNYKPAEFAQLIQEVIDEKVNVNTTTSEWRTLLHVAVKYGDLAAVEKLIKAGANVNIPDNEGNTPLHEIMTGLALKNAYAKVANDQTAFEAIRDNNNKIIHALITAGAEKNATNKEGKTPIELAHKSKDVHKDAHYFLERAFMDRLLEEQAVIDFQLERLDNTSDNSRQLHAYVEQKNIENLSNRHKPASNRK